MGTLIKNFCSFEKTIDFNFISNLLDRNNFKSKISSNYLNDFIFESVFKIESIENDYFFKNIFDLLNNTYNLENKKSDLFLFLSFVSGNKSITHKDEYDVYILELFGKTMYKVEKEEFMLEPNDLLFIPKNKIHKAIGLTPRICLSYAIY
jgi:hypothetical protein